MTLEKGAMVFHMLRWEMGDDAFIKTLREALLQYSDKGIRENDLITIASAQTVLVDGDQTHLNLQPFFSQWVNGTGAPQFNDKYTVYRLGSNKGFRTVRRHHPGPGSLPHAR